MSVDISGPLVQLNTTWQALATSTSLPEVKDFRDRAAAIQVWLREQRAGFELQNQVAEMKIRAERRLGELLRDTVRAGNPQLLHDATISLDDLGIEKTASHRWQSVANLAEAVFEAYLSEMKAARDELTTAALLRLARSLVRQVRQDAVEEAVYATSIEMDLLRLIDDGKRFATIYADPPWP